MTRKLFINGLIFMSFVYELFYLNFVQVTSLFKQLPYATKTFRGLHEVFLAETYSDPCQTSKM